MMIRVRQQRSDGIAVKKLTMIRMDRGLQQVRKQSTDHPDTRRQQYLPDFDRPVNQLAVQQPANSPYACSDHCMLLCVRHLFSPLSSDRHYGTAPVELAFAFRPVVLPLQRLKVRNLIRPAFRNRKNMVDLPTFSVRGGISISVPLNPPPASVFPKKAGIHARNDRTLLPHRLNGPRIERRPRPLRAFTP